MNRKIKFLLILICCILILAVLQTLPVFFLKPLGAKEIKGKDVIVFYQPGAEKGAQEVFDLFETKYVKEIREKLEFNSSKPTTVYVYSNQKSFSIRESGFISLLSVPKWVVGNNKGKNVLLVSPYTEVKGYTHDGILYASIHELVHSINYQINPKLSYWNDNGVAQFISVILPGDKFIKDFPIPTLDDLKSKDKVRFGNIGGYMYSYTYIEFLNEKYGWDKVLDMITGEKTFNDIFSKSERDIYNEWLKYLNDNYKN